MSQLNTPSPNRLSKETSPYLKQHQLNPVDWYPWGDEAFEKAKAENKPILLSIGYSACHWCHVMEHESFENPATAGLMNEHFVSIKVDREERPDLDQVYQNVAQLMTGGGGWPLTVFLTPEGEPFFGGTYFPPEDRYGRPGFPKLLTSIAQAFHTQKEDILANTTQLMNAISNLESFGPQDSEVPTNQRLHSVFKNMVSWVDWKNGGFGEAPKFPNPMNLTFLWRYGMVSGVGMATDAVIFSLEQMAKSGTYDQLGGGFHRYSVDARWSVPHFEKMLYDNALLLKTYSEVLTTGSSLPLATKALFQKTIQSTFDYLLREMSSPFGGFYSTQDADSEGEEGRFFVWTPKEIHSILDLESAEIFCKHFGITEEGNFEESGSTVLFQSPDSPVKTTEDEEKLHQACSRVFEARKKRVHPGLDHKILSSWNGLLISGLCFAHHAFIKSGDHARAELALNHAEKIFKFLKDEMTDSKSGTLFSTWSAHTPTEKGSAKTLGFLDDHAFCAMAAIDLSRTVSDPEESHQYLIQASQWSKILLEKFKDSAGGGFFFVSTEHEKLICKPKSLYDQAIPSGNSVAIENMLVLTELGYDEDGLFEKQTSESLQRFFPLLEKQSFGLGELANAALMAMSGVVSVRAFFMPKDFFHPLVYWKFAEQKEFSLCHKKTCYQPVATTELMLSQVQERTKIAL